MTLTSEEVQHIMLLSRLALAPAEQEKAAVELSHILEHFELLRKLDTSDVEPTDHVLLLHNVLRDDQVRAGLSPQAALANAPEQAAGMFQVPRVVEAE